MPTLSTQKHRPNESLTRQASRGFLWMAIQTIGTKFGSVLAQLALTWLLAKEDFGIFALAVMTTSFIQVLQQNGLKQILIHRQARFDRWVHAAFWLSATISAITFITMTVAAPLIATWFHHPKLLGITILVAVASLFDGLCVVPNAILERDLRFGTLAKVGLTGNLATSGLSVLFAVIGLGVYAFVLPLPLVAFFKSIYLFQKSHFRPVSRLFLRRWRFLLPDSAFVMGTSLATTVIYQGDNLVLGILHSVEVVGVYFLAFNLSTQAMQLVAGNLGGVLMPALSKLGGDLVRQKNACLRAARMLLFCGVPLCFLQAAMARPLITFAMAAKWQPTIPVLQVLSIALSISLASNCTAAALSAQGRFRFYFVWNTVSALIFLMCVATGAIAGKSPGLNPAVCVAAGVGVCYLLISPWGLYLAVRPGGGRFYEVAAVYVRPIVCSTAALAASLFLQGLVPGAVLEGVVAFAAFVVVLAAGYMSLARSDIAMSRAILAQFKKRGGATGVVEPGVVE